MDTDGIDFENQVVGETRKKTVTLKNNGALPTDYRFCLINGIQFYQ